MTPNIHTCIYDSKYTTNIPGPSVSAAPGWRSLKNKNKQLPGGQYIEIANLQMVSC